MRLLPACCCCWRLSASLGFCRLSQRFPGNPLCNPPPPGAHNTIVTSRAGKDLISCLVSGLLTIGPRFGGAIDDAARYFRAACDKVGRGGPTGLFLLQLSAHCWF